MYFKEYKGDFRALSVQQPWAALIAQGEKTIEIRRWHTIYRGDLLIVASKNRVDKLAYKHLTIPLEGRFEKRGLALCLAEIYDVQYMEPGDENKALCPFVPYYFSWKLRNIRPVKPVSVKGQLKLFTPRLTENLKIQVE